MKIVWLAPYPVSTLAPDLELTRTPQQEHSCSWIVNLAGALSQRRNIELHLVTESTCLNRPQQLKRAAIIFHVVPSGLPLLGRGLPSWLPLEALTGFRRRARRLAGLVREINPRLVHAHGTEAAYARGGAMSGLPWLTSIQGVITEYYRAEPSLNFAVLRHWEQASIKRCRFFTCRTAFDSGFVRTCNPTARIFDIAEAMNPVFFATQRCQPAEPVLLFVGSLDGRKGLAYLLEALWLLRQNRPATRLLVVGGSRGGPPGKLRKLVEQLGLCAAVDFLGPKTAEQISQLQQQAAVFVLPSLIENSPNSLAEAMVAGLPVVATAVGGVPSMVEDGRTGLLVPARNHRALAERIEWLLQNPAAAAVMGTAAQQEARRRHHPAAVAEQTCAAYRQILEQCARP